MSVQYLGPSPALLILFFTYITVNSLTLFAVAVIFLKSLWSLATNVTSIESWEIERHETLARRAKTMGGFLNGPDGVQVHIVKQEFPYDIGILHNINQAMGGTFLTWLLPFAKTPSSDSGLAFESNGFEGTVEQFATSEF